VSRRQRRGAGGLAPLAASAGDARTRSPFWSRRKAMKAIAANTTTVAARVAAPLPTGEKARLARKTEGTAASVGSHESRHVGICRNATARISNAAKVAPTVKPDSILWACECQESFSQPASISWQSSRKMPSRNVPVPVAINAAAPRRPRVLGLSVCQRARPSAMTNSPERCGQLVVAPRAAGRQSPEVGDIVVGRTEGGRLSEVARDPADVERHEGKKTAQGGETHCWHVRSLVDDREEVRFHVMA